MANIFEFPVANPLRVIWQSDVLQTNSGTQYLNAFNPSFNTKQFESDFLYNILKPFEQKILFAQKFQQSDIIRFQFFGSDTTLGHYQHARLLMPTGAEYTNKTITVVQESGTWDGLKLYTIEFSLWDVPEGYYFLQIGYNPASSNQYAICEPIHVKQTHQRTIRLDYSNSKNSQNIVYPSTAYIPQLRTKGYLKLLPPEADFHVYIDQPMNKEMVSGTASRIYELVVEDVSDWMLDKLNRVLLCDSVYADGFAITREPGAKFEPVVSDETNPLGTYKIKVGERFNTSTNDIYAATVIFGSMPQTKYFWVEAMSIGTSINIRKMFRGKRNFLDYLNTTYLLSSGFWAEDGNNKLVFVLKSGATLSGTNTLAAADVLQYGVRYLLSGANDFGQDINAPSAGNYYAVVWGDGSANINKSALATTPSVTTVAKSYLTNKERECFVFTSNAKSMADNALTITCKEIGGDLPPGLTYFKPFVVNVGLLKLENNLFKYVTALATFDLSGQLMDTWAINELVRNILEQIGHFAPTASVIINGQTPAAPPSKNDPGIGSFLTKIKSAISTLTTD